MFRIVSWNCQYEWEKRQGLTLEKLEKISMYNSDVLVIQECTKRDFDAIKKEYKYKNWYCDDMEDSVLGIAILSKETPIEFTENFNRNFRYVVPFKIKINKKFIDLFAIWIKAPLDGKQNYAKEIYKALEYYKPSEKTIMIGDFNIGSNLEHPDRYSEVLEQFDSYNFNNAAKDTEFEFENTHWNANTKKNYLNDFCFCSADLKVHSFEIPEKDNWEQVGELKKWNKISDHSPIIVDFEF